MPSGLLTRQTERQCRQTKQAFFLPWLLAGAARRTKRHRRSSLSSFFFSIFSILRLSSPLLKGFASSHCGCCGSSQPAPLAVSLCHMSRCCWRPSNCLANTVWSHNGDLAMSLWCWRSDKHLANNVMVSHWRESFFHVAGNFSPIYLPSQRTKSRGVTQPRNLSPALAASCNQCSLTAWEISCLVELGIQWL